jgi:hypothetical protein
LQQASRGRDHLKPGFGTITVTELHDSWRGLKSDTGSAVSRSALGEVCHGSPTMAPQRSACEITEAHCTDSFRRLG